MQKVHPSTIALKVLAKVNNRDVLPAVKVPIKRAPRSKETKPREQPEREFRNKVAIPYLQRKGCIVKRIENSICGKRGRGVADLWVFCRRTKWGGWVELKAPGCGLVDDEQIEFRNMCIQCNINHVVANKVEDLYLITGEIMYK